MKGKNLKRIVSLAALSTMATTSLTSGVVYAKDKTVHMVGNAHIDDAWNWRIEETIRDVIRNTFNQALNIMDDDPDYHYSQSSSQLYKWAEDYYPEMFERIKEKVKSGQWEIVGGQVCEPDLNVPSGESLVRQSLYGQRYFRDKFGESAKVGFVPDVFGFSYAMPQILKKSGMDYFITSKLTWNDTSKFPYDLFRWQSADGSNVLAYKTKYNYEWHDNQISQGGIEATLEYPNSIGLNESIVLYGRGDHGGGPTKSDLSTIRNSDNNSKIANVKISKLIEAFGSIENDIEKTGSEVPVKNDELYLQKHRGVYTTSGPIKKYNRISEIKAEETEKFASIANLYGAAAYPADKIQKAWEITCLNHFHDILPGSSIRQVYDDAFNDAEIALNYLNKSLESALDGLTYRADTQGAGVPVVAFNPLSWDRTNLVEAEVRFDSEVDGVEVYDTDGTKLPVQILEKEGNRAKISFEAEVPSMGYKVFRVVSCDAEDTASLIIVDENNLVIENNYLKLELDSENGNISSLYDKTNKKEVFKDGEEGNVLQWLEDTPREYDAWDMDRDDMQRQATDINGLESIELVENGPLRAAFRVTRNWSGSTFVQDITVYANSDKVDVKNNFDWHEQHKALKVSFPLSVSPEKATYEIAYGSIERPTSNEYREQGMFEVSGHKWADMTEGDYGVSILNDSKYGWDVLDNRLRLTLLRSPHDRGGIADRGHHEFTYSICPHSGDWKEANTVRKGYELNYPVIVKQTTKHDGDLGKEKSFASVDKDNILISVMKKAEEANNDSDMIIRLYEAEGEENTTTKITLPSKVKCVKEVNLIEDDMDGAESVSNDGNTVTVNLKKYEIKTLRVELEQPSEYRDTESIATKIDLSSEFNIDGMSYDSDRTDGDFNDNGWTYSADLMPDEIVSQGVVFDIGSKEDGANNFVQAKGQTINLPAGKHKYLYILGASGGDNKKGIFNVNYTGGSSSEKEIYFTDWMAKVGQRLKTYVKEPIAYRVDHNHKPSGNTYDIDNQLYVYRIGLDNAKDIESITLPDASGIKIASMSFVDGESVKIADVEAPTAVESFKAETPLEKYSDYVNLTWDAASDNISVESYIVYRGLKEDMSDAKMITKTSATTYRDEDVNSPQKYYYMVKAEDAEGNLSPDSNIVSAYAGSNFSYGKPIEADSHVNSSEAPQYAVDGDTSTKWCANSSGNHWLVVDLQQKIAVSKIVINHAEAGGENSSWNTADFKIQVSDDKDEWKDIVNVTGNTEAVTEHVIDNIEGRYVRLYVTKPTSDNDPAVRIYEFTVKGAPAEAPTEAPKDAPVINSLKAVDGTATIEFASVKDATSYTIKYGTEPGNYTDEITNVNVLKYSIDNLEVGKTYYFTVLGVNDIGEGPAAQEISVKVEQSDVLVIDLGDEFNLDGISTDNNYADGNFDGVGWSYSAELIPDTVKVSDVKFEFGSKEDGANNVIKALGQTIDLPNVKTDGLYFLGAAHDGDQTGRFTVTYEDGTTKEMSIGMTDWCSAPKHEGETLAIAMEHRHASGKDMAATPGDCGPAPHINMYKIELDAEKNVKSIILPNDQYIKLFAISLNIVGETITEEFTITHKFNLDSLAAGERLEAAVNVTNNTEEVQQVKTIMALYDEKNTLIKVDVASSDIAVGEAASLKPAFDLPDNVENLNVKVFVWNGTSLEDSNMIPLTKPIVMGNN